MYALNSTGSIRRTADGACIPADPANGDYAAYLAWVAQGGVPQPYVAPVPTADQARVAEIETTIAADATVQMLKAATSAEFDAWWAANVTTLTQASVVLRRIARIVVRRLA